MFHRSFICALALATALMVTMSGAHGADATATDGVVLIDQARALAGNVTPGDAPGFPVTISEPGSYRLASDLESDNGGILIAADDDRRPAVCRFSSSSIRSSAPQVKAPCVPPP